MLEDLLTVTSEVTSEKVLQPREQPWTGKPHGRPAIQYQGEANPSQSPLRSRVVVVATKCPLHVVVKRDPYFVTGNEERRQLALALRVRSARRRLALRRTFTLMLTSIASAALIVAQLLERPHSTKWSGCGRY